MTPAQGYLAILLVAVAAAVEWGPATGIGLGGGLLLLDAWRPWHRPLVLRPDTARKSES